jgi:hypothetical protein
MMNEIALENNYKIIYTDNYSDSEEIQILNPLK